jgi:hypothetical protein
VSSGLEHGNEVIGFPFSKIALNHEGIAVVTLPPDFPTSLCECE